jgi:hypothetical protein
MQIAPNHLIYLLDNFQFFQRLLTIFRLISLFCVMEKIKGKIRKRFFCGAACQPASPTATWARPVSTLLPAATAPIAYDKTPVPSSSPFHAPSHAFLLPLAISGSGAARRGIFSPTGRAGQRLVARVSVELKAPIPFPDIVCSDSASQSRSTTPPRLHRGLKPPCRAVPRCCSNVGELLSRAVLARSSVRLRTTLVTPVPCTGSRHRLRSSSPS